MSNKIAASRWYWNYNWEIIQLHFQTLVTLSQIEVLKKIISQIFLLKYVIVPSLDVHNDYCEILAYIFLYTVKQYIKKRLADHSHLKYIFV